LPGAGSPAGKPKEEEMLEAPLLAAFILVAASTGAPPPSVERARLDEAQQAYQRGQERMQSESFEEAARHFRTAIALDPMHWLAHYGLGQAPMALKHYPEAVKAYLSCRDVFVGFASLDAWQQNSLEKNREDEIREVRDTLLAVQQGKIKGSRPGAINASLEVQLQERLRVLEGARMRGKERVVAVPGALMLGLGSAYFRSGQMAEAEAAFLEAVKIDPKLGPAHNNLAVMHMMSGRFEEAEQEVRRAEKAGTPVSDTFKRELARRAKEAEAPKPR
jgi:tetratricopeptide (TPR) repeat protein